MCIKPILLCPEKVTITAARGKTLLNEGLGGEFLKLATEWLIAI